MSEERGMIGSINQSRKKDEEEVNISGKVHQLPCCIKFNGPCSASHYFKPRATGTDVDGLRDEEAYFRGRKLQGSTISLPNGYSGFVLGKKRLDKKRARDTPKGNPNCWEMKAKFDKLAYWNDEIIPSKDDAFLRRFHWFAVAEALHKPVKAEDLATMLLLLLGIVDEVMERCRELLVIVRFIPVSFSSFGCESTVGSKARRIDKKTER